jgi:hypothetical protein
VPYTAYSLPCLPYKVFTLPLLLCRGVPGCLTHCRISSLTLCDLTILSISRAWQTPEHFRNMLRFIQKLPLFEQRPGKRCMLRPPRRNLLLCNSKNNFAYPALSCLFSYSIHCLTMELNSRSTASPVVPLQKSRFCVLTAQGPLFHSSTSVQP